MPGRFELLATGEVYHILNKTVNNQEVFTGKHELRRASELIDYCRFVRTLSYSKYKRLPVTIKKEYLESIKSSTPLVTLYAYAFMPNHYHILLKQNRDGGISKFISSFQNSFAKYFNTKHKREGGLFKRPFKSKRIYRDSDLMHILRYIHLNPVTSFLIDFDRLDKYEWTSFPNYLDNNENDLIETDFILKLFGSYKNKVNYHKFHKDRVNYQRKLAEIKRFLLE